MPTLRHHALFSACGRTILRLWRICLWRNHSPFTIHHSRSDSKAGLTLVEVLIALAILAISAAVLMTATSRCLAVVRLSKNYYEARRILELGEIEHPILIVNEKAAFAADAGSNTDKLLNPNVGPFEYPGGFMFNRSCKRSEKHEDLVEVQTRVTWSTRGKEAFEEVTSYLYFTNEISM